MDTKTTLLYATLPVWNTVFSLISKSTLGEIGAKSYTATVLMITAILPTILVFLYARNCLASE